MLRTRHDPHDMTLAITDRLWYFAASRHQVVDHSNGKSRVLRFSIKESHSKVIPIAEAKK